MAVMESTALRFAPEVYPTQGRASKEAYRWRWFLSRGDESKVVEVAENHWRIGRTHVHLGTAGLSRLPDDAAIWVGLQTKGPSYDAGFALFPDRNSARAWVTSGSTYMKRRSREHALFTSAEYGSENVDLWVAAYAGKIGASFDAAIDTPLPEPQEAGQYEVRVTATYSYAIHATITSDKGLTEEELGEVIERKFPDLSAYRGMPIGASWQLESFKELNAGRSVRSQPNEDPTS
ncbi:MAG: hypothetical protein ABI595_13720 [Actinomycetota bacterium]